MNKEGKLCALLGDFNVNLLNVETHKPTEEFVNAMSTNFFEPHIVKPTRITYHTATLIDNIFFNSIDFHTISGNVVYDLSDHLPNFLIINDLDILCDSKDRVFVRDFSRLNEDSVLNDFATIQWQDVLSESRNVNQLFDVFFSKCSEIVNKHLSMRKLSRREVKFNSKPWITKGLRKSINNKNIMYRHFVRTKSSYSHHEYKMYRNKLTSLLRLSKKLYYQSYFKINQHNMKNIWTGIRQLVSLKKKAYFKPNKLMKDGQDIIDLKLMANEFNNYFATIGSRLAAEIPNCGTCTHKTFLNNPHSSSFGNCEEQLTSTNRRPATGRQFFP